MISTPDQGLSELLSPPKQRQARLQSSLGCRENWPLYDVEHGKRAIGYEPQDYSEVPEEEWGR